MLFVDYKQNNLNRVLILPRHFDGSDPGSSVLRRGLDRLDAASVQDGLSLYESGHILQRFKLLHNKKTPNHQRRLDS